MSHNKIMDKHIWLFDINRRVYHDADGNKQSHPIYREHWDKYRIEGETSQSWVLSNGAKVPKDIQKRKFMKVAFSLEEVERDVYMETNTHKLSEKIRTLKDYDKLKKIAELLEEKQ